MLRRNHQNISRRIIEQQLSENQSGLDCLAKPDLIRQEIALYRIAEDLSGDAELVGVVFDRRRKDACAASNCCSLKQHVVKKRLAQLYE